MVRVPGAGAPVNQTCTAMWLSILMTEKKTRSLTKRRFHSERTSNPGYLNRYARKRKPGSMFTEKKEQDSRVDVHIPYSLIPLKS